MMNTALTITKIIPAMLAIVLGSTLVLSGCQTVKGAIGKRDNGSLDYQDSKKLAPLQLPANQTTAAFVPLYPTPSVGANTLTLQNDAGKQYQLPKPERAISMSSSQSN